jgi:predicted AlkP superfamily phosphohydrolase/phosphomutase
VTIRFRSVLPAVLGALLIAPATADAYIGPGAGFALLSSFLVLFTTILLALASALVWPFRALWRVLRHGRRVRPLVGRLIVVGLDGQDPVLTDRFLAEGRLPNFGRLAGLGGYHRLRTTFPSVSPVAWSSFSTGTSPARHNIFDFLDRDRRTYLPVLSSAHIGSVTRVLKIGRFRIPLARPEIRLLRKSRPFWAILGDHRIWSTILRVPVTFPPDRFYGAELSAMCVPDLLGTQGTFTLYTTRPTGERFKEGGTRIPLRFDGDRADTVIRGPDNSLVEGSPPMELPLRITVDRARASARVRVGDRQLDLEPGRLSDWITLAFRAAPGVRVSGICRMQLTEAGEHVSLYVTPINIDPEKPAMPISHPSYYATYLAKKIGTYATLGLAEDTWALNEGVIDEGTFLQQTWDIDTERQEMFFAALDRLERGCLVCVFDATDRVQHMFWRYLDAGHPAAGGRSDSRWRDAIRTLYERNDALVGRVLDRLREGDALFVLSDHGFNAFRRGVNLNGWLHEQGYLALKPGADGTTEWLRDVDWGATRAYAIGLTGMFLNLKGRESQGVVEPGAEADALKDEIQHRLAGLMDAETGQVGVRTVYDTATLYHGPYLENAPDLLIGYNAGYRISWDSATGIVAGPVFEDNVKAWSGDHCIDPRLVPGVLFTNRRIEVADPALVDIAPTALRLFGIEPPAYMEGRSLVGNGAAAAGAGIEEPAAIGPSTRAAGAGRAGERDGGLAPRRNGDSARGADGVRRHSSAGRKQAALTGPRKARRRR